MGPTSGQRWGACFPAQCPMCAHDVTFNLLVRLVGFESIVIGVICPKCRHEIRADDREEREKLLQASELWKRQDAGELDAAAFAMALDELRLATLDRIISEARTWTCPSCQSQNPLNFVTCWSCAHERPLTSEEATLDYIDESEDEV